MRTVNRIGRSVLPVTLTVIIVLLVGASGALADAPPVKLVQTNQIGWEVDPASKGNICAVTSGECQPAVESAEPGGFVSPEGAAGAPNGDFYVADTGNHRVQEFTANGEFVLMFGDDVNASTKGNVCTEEEIVKSKGAVKCQAGTSGGAAGQFGSPQSVTVDPSSGNVYVTDLLLFGQVVVETVGERVQEFTPGGQFVLEIGQEVNEKTHGNLCTEKEVEEKTGVTCGEAAQRPLAEPSSGHGSFLFVVAQGLVAAGGEHDLLYVGENERIQEFNADGVWKGEIPLSGELEAFAVAGGSSNVYLAYNHQGTVRELGPEGSELRQLPIQPREQGGNVAQVSAIAVDSADRIAVKAQEAAEGSIEGGPFGALYESASGPQLPGFTVPRGTAVKAMSFNGAGDMYAAAAGANEVLSYSPQAIAELTTGTPTCAEGAGQETSVTFNCTLKGEVNPFAVANTNAWFEWGRTCTLGTQTPPKGLASIEGALAVEAPIEGLRPAESFCDQVVGSDQHVQSPEKLTGERATFKTPAVPAKIIGVPQASFAGSSSAVLFGELNPENAGTEYFFEYAPETQPGESTLAACPGIKTDAAACPRVASTPVGETSLYGKEGVTLQASGLQPGTVYHYRLAASNAGGQSTGKGAGQEGSFTTAPAPAVSAVTGAVSGIGTTSATASGTIDPDGQPATYTFELGVYEGAATRYEVVISGPTGTVTEAESLLLSGLQPGTQYAYRITVTSGYGTATGQPVTFTTTGLPSTLISPTPLAMLAIPGIAFPVEGKPAVVKKNGQMRQGQEAQPRWQMR